MICTTLFRDFRKNYGELVPCRWLLQTACRAPLEPTLSLALTQCLSAHRLAPTTTRPSSPLWKERKRTKKESKKNGKRTQLRYDVGIGRSRRESFSRIREFSFAHNGKNMSVLNWWELENTMALEVVLSFFNALFPSFSNSFNNPFMRSGACKAIRLHWFHSVIQSQELENSVVIVDAKVFSFRYRFHTEFRFRMKFFRVSHCFIISLRP